MGLLWEEAGARSDKPKASPLTLKDSSSIHFPPLHQGVLRILLNAY